MSAWAKLGNEKGRAPAGGMCVLTKTITLVEYIIGKALIQGSGFEKAFGPLRGQRDMYGLLWPFVMGV